MNISGSFIILDDPVAFMLCPGFQSFDKYINHSIISNLACDGLTNPDHPNQPMVNTMDEGVPVSLLTLYIEHFLHGKYY